MSMLRTPMTSAFIIYVLALVFVFPSSTKADQTSTGSKHGAKLYKQLCRGCHGADGRGGAHTFMPHVGNLTKKDYIENLPDDYLMLVIAKGGVAVGKSSYMPAWDEKLSTQDIKEIIAHIRSLPRY